MRLFLYIALLLIPLTGALGTENTVKPFPLINKPGSKNILLAQNVIRKKNVIVRVNFNFEVPDSRNSEEDDSGVQARGRKIFYNLAHKECALLTEMLADTCEIQSINLGNRRSYTGANRRYNNPVKITGSVSYKITLKKNK